MGHSHELSLVILSIIVALVGSYVALDFSEQATVAEEETGRFRWLFGGGTALGMTIWAMHFTAMLAFETKAPITWDFVIVFVAMMVAIAGSTAGLIVVGRRRVLARWALLGGSVFVGFSIVGMHFAAMAAMRIEALPVYSVWWVLISAVVAVSGSGTSLWLVFRGRPEEATSSVPAELARKVASTALQSFAIVGMHYAAMEAMSLIPTPGARNPSEQPVSPAFSNSLLGWSVGGVTLLVLVLTLFGSSYGRRVRAKAAATAAGEEAGRAAREEGEHRFRSLVQNSSEVVKITDASGTLRYASPAFGRVFGHDPEEAVGENILNYVHPDDLPRVREETAKALEDPEIDSNTVEYRFRHADGSWRHVEAVGTYMLDDPAVEGVVVNVRDITERKEFEERLAHQAFHDPLTGLPNRALLLDRIRQALSRSRRHRDRENQGSSGVALLFLDLDNFKEVNDSLGHEAGDELLVAVATRLKKTVRPEDTLARLGGDEFCVLLEDLDSSDTGPQTRSGAAEAARAAERILEELRRPVFKLGLGGRQGESKGNWEESGGEQEEVGKEEGRWNTPTEVFVTASIGITLSGDSSQGGSSHHRPADLLKEADLAVYRAKERGKGRYEVFEPSLAREVEERMKLKGDLERALEREEFELYYQPQVGLETGEILWMEGLLRWNHPERGLLLPGEFISAAEESGLIVPIGRWAMEEALRQGRRWQEQGEIAPDGHVVTGVCPGVCVNVSARQLEQSGLARDVADAIQENQTAPETFGLEVTESLLMEDERALDTLRELRDMGLAISIDDFGTGYASLSYLKLFPADVLKIDCSFIEGFEENPQDAVMVSGMINLAHATGKEVVAECVENTRQLNLLREAGCEMGQGYLFSKALPPEEAARLVADYSRDEFVNLDGH